jgi:prevent-host-death family protein
MEDYVKTVTTHQAKTHLSRLLKEAQAGEKIVITNGKVPVAQLTSLTSVDAGRPVVGTPTSEPVKYTDDAFRPLTDEELKGWGL